MKNIILFFILISSAAMMAQDTLSYVELVQRLYDLEYLANPPQKGEQAGNFSSYDRRSRYDTISQTYVQWNANSDGSGFIRKEGNDIVIFEKDGPGVIWRFWSALAREGHIKIFIDNDEAPVIDEPFRDFFEKFDNDTPPMNFPNLVMTLSRGRNHYLPIPFNKHCKILLSENWGAYYHITYTKFPSNTIIQSFSGRMSKADCFALADADRFLGNRGNIAQKFPGDKVEKLTIQIKPWGKVLVKEFTGNKVITGLKFAFNGFTDEKTISSLLNDLWLQITWDSDKVPAVLAPLGMFFGTGNGLHPYRSLPLGVIGNELYSNWFMPFSEKARIEIVNKGNIKAEMGCSVTYGILQQPASQLLRFHSQWHNGEPYKLISDSAVKSEYILKNFNDSKSIPFAGREIDWPLFKARGRGRFCGLTFHVENRWEEPEQAAETWWYGKWNRKTIDWWWGEGDEKFFVDGERFPSTFGTGSEDYIGYAWSAEPPFPIFDSPFACQPYIPVNGNGHTIVNRFHIADNIPFQESFEAYLEKYKNDRWGKNNVCLYDLVVYWYQ